MPNPGPLVGVDLDPFLFLYGFFIGLVAQMNFTVVLAVILTVLVLAGWWCVCKGMRNQRKI